MFAMLAKLRTVENIIFHLASAWNHSFRFGGFLRHSVETVKKREPNFYKTLSTVLLGRAPSRVSSWKYIQIAGWSCRGSCFRTTRVCFDFAPKN